MPPIFRRNSTIPDNIKKFLEFLLKEDQFFYDMNMFVKTFSQLAEEPTDEALPLLAELQTLLQALPQIPLQVTANIQETEMSKALSNIRQKIAAIKAKLTLIKQANQPPNAHCELLEDLDILDVNLEALVNHLQNIDIISYKQNLELINQSKKRIDVLIDVKKSRQLIKTENKKIFLENVLPLFKLDPSHNLTKCAMQAILRFLDGRLRTTAKSPEEYGEIEKQILSLKKSDRFEDYKNLIDTDENVQKFFEKNYFEILKDIGILLASCGKVKFAKLTELSMLQDQHGKAKEGIYQDIQIALESTKAVIADKPLVNFFIDVTIAPAQIVGRYELLLGAMIESTPDENSGSGFGFVKANQGNNNLSILHSLLEQTKKFNQTLHDTLKYTTLDTSQYPGGITGNFIKNYKRLIHVYLNIY